MNEALLDASATGDFAAVVKAIDAGADVHCAISTGWTPLHMAAYDGHVAIVEKLLQVGAQVNVVDVNKTSPLLWAASKGHLTIVEKLLNAGAFVNQVGIRGYTALCWAAQANHFEIARVLMDAGADPRIRANNDHTAAEIFEKKGNTTAALYLRHYQASMVALKEEEYDPEAVTVQYFSAMESGEIEMVRQIVDVVDVHCRGNGGMTPLHVAAQYGQFSIVQRLMNRGASLTARGDNGRTPLHVACASGDVKSVALMVDNGARLETVDDHGFTPVDVAARYGHQDVVRELVNCGASLTNVAFDSRTVLHQAVLSHDAGLVEYLLKQDGIDVNAIDAQHSTPLHYAVQAPDRNTVIQGLPKPRRDATSEKRRLAVLTLLLSAKDIDVNVQNEKGKTPLMVALASNQYKPASLLITSGVDVNLQNHKQETALFIASEQGNVMIVRLLLCNGARTDIIDTLGRPLVTVSSQRGIRSVVQLYHRSYQFHERCFMLLNDPTTPSTVSQLQQLVPLITSVYDLRFILALTTVCGENDILVRMVLKEALHHAVDNDLLFDDDTWVFYKMVLEHCGREKLLARKTILLLDRQAEKANTKREGWVVQMKKHVHTTSWRLAAHQQQLQTLLDVVGNMHTKNMEHRLALVSTIERLEHLQSQIREGKQLLTRLPTYDLQMSSHVENFTHRLTKSEQNVNNMASYFVSTPRSRTQEGVNQIDQEEMSKWGQRLCGVAASVVAFVLVPTLPTISDKIVDFMCPMEILISCGVHDMTKFLLADSGQQLPDVVQSQLLKHGFQPEVYEELLREGIALTHPEIVNKCTLRGRSVPTLGVRPDIARLSEPLLDTEIRVISDLLTELRLASKEIGTDGTGEPNATASMAPYLLQQVDGEAAVQLVWAHDGERLQGHSYSEPHKPVSGIPMARPVTTDKPTDLTQTQSIDETAQVSSSVEFYSDSAAFPYHMAAQECRGDVFVFQELTKSIEDSIDPGASMEMWMNETLTTMETLCAAQYAYLRGYRKVGDAVVARMTNPLAFDQEPVKSIQLQDDIELYPYVMFVVESDGDVVACEDFMDTLEAHDPRINDEIKAVVVRERSCQVVWTVYEYASHLGYVDVVKYLLKSVCRDVPMKTRVQVMKQTRERANIVASSA